MKKYFIPFLLSIGFPLSVSATNYVECEAIRAVIIRNQSQMNNSFDEIRSSFHRKKVNEKYGVKTCNLVGNYDVYMDRPKIDECVSYRGSTLKTFEAEWNEFYKASIKVYEDINARATKDFKKRGCYYF